MTHAEIVDIRKEMVTKEYLERSLEHFPTKETLKDMEDRLVMHLTELKAGVKQVIADEAVNTVEIAHVKERLARVEKKLGLRVA